MNSRFYGEKIKFLLLGSSGVSKSEHLIVSDLVRDNFINYIYLKGKKRRKGIFLYNNYRGERKLPKSTKEGS